MASRLLQSVKNRSFNILARCQSTHAASPVPVHQQAIAEVQLPSFESEVELYSAFSTRELLFSYLNMRMVCCEPLANLGMATLRSPLMKYYAYRSPLLYGVKKTLFRHFCAGETVADASVTLNRMWSVGLKGILDYSLEDAADNKACDANLRQFLATIDTTLQLPPGSVSFSCVKITALCPLELLERVSHLLRWQHQNPNFRLPWKADCIPVLATTSPTHHTRSKPEPLSLEEERDLNQAEQRLMDLCRACETAQLPLLVDAEYSYVQPAIDYLTYRTFSEFNKGKKALVYGTLQAYLKDSFPRLTVAADEAKRQGITLALKLVRGAYITRENAEAAAVGAPSPVNSSITETHRCYNACASYLMERIPTGDASLLLATHNVESAKLACHKSDELGIRKEDPALQFAQLKGMADNLSLRLVKAGFHVNKYLPFGPVEKVMPYLIRRAEENKGMLSTCLLDAKNVRDELKSRLKGGRLMSFHVY